MNPGYIDRLETPKFEAIAAEARKRAATVVYGALLTTNRPSNIRCKTMTAREWDDLVLRVTSGDYHRQISKEMSVRMVACLKDFARSRQACIADVIDTIVASTRPVVVFLDPDTGIYDQSKPAFGSPTDPRYITPAELQQVFNSLGPGDALMMYQHNMRFRAWQDHYAAHMQAQISCPAVVGNDLLRQACIIVAAKP